jgi:plasmid maintenance system antidote protein VapI
MADVLGGLFGVSPQLLLNLQKAYDRATPRTEQRRKKNEHQQRRCGRDHRTDKATQQAA